MTEIVWPEKREIPPIEYSIEAAHSDGFARGYNFAIDACRAAYEAATPAKQSKVDPNSEDYKQGWRDAKRRYEDDLRPPINTLNKTGLEALDYEKVKSFLIEQRNYRGEYLGDELDNVADLICKRFGKPAGITVERIAEIIWDLKNSTGQLPPDIEVARAIYSAIQEGK